MESYAQQEGKSLAPRRNENGATEALEQVSKSSGEGIKIGRPRKKEADKYKKVCIRLHPDVFERAKAEAARRGIGYQSIINETLLEHLG